MSNRKQTDRLIVEFTRTAVSILDLRKGDLFFGKSNLHQDRKVEFFDATNLATHLQAAVDASTLRRPFSATICLPRCIACVRVVELPPMGNHEIVAAVNLELEAALGEEKDQFVSDFVSVDNNGETPHFAVIYSVPKRILEAVQVALNQTQISFDRITLSEFGYGGSASVPGLVHMLALHDQRLDVLVCYRNTIVQSQSFTIDPTGPCDFAQFRGALRRLHASLPESMQALEPRKQLLRIRSPMDNHQNGDSCFEQSLIDSCKSNDFSIDNVTLDRLFGCKHRSANLCIDFAHPKKAVAPFVSRRSVAAVLMATALTSSVAFWVVKQHETAELAIQVKSCTQKLAETERKITALSGKVEAASKLAQWDESNVRWKDPIGAISKQISKSDDLYLVRLQMDNRTFWERKPVTRLEGRSKSSQSILQMTRALAAENPSFSIQPNGIEPNSVDPEFNSQFRIEIEEAADTPSQEANQEKGA